MPMLRDRIGRPGLIGGGRDRRDDRRDDRGDRRPGLIGGATTGETIAGMTGATGAMTGKTVGGAGLDCSGNREPDDQGACGR